MYCLSLFCYHFEYFKYYKFMMIVIRKSHRRMCSGIFYQILFQIYVRKTQESIQTLKYLSQLLDGILHKYEFDLSLLLNKEKEYMLLCNVHQKILPAAILRLEVVPNMLVQNLLLRLAFWAQLLFLESPGKIFREPEQTHIFPFESSAVNLELTLILQVFLYFAQYTIPLVNSSYLFTTFSICPFRTLADSFNFFNSSSFRTGFTILTTPLLFKIVGAAK